MLRDASLDLPHRRFRGKHAASKREPQSVTGHRIHETGGVACEQEPRASGTGRVDGKRAEHGHRGDPSRVRESAAQVRITGNRVRDQVRETSPWGELCRRPLMVSASRIQMWKLRPGEASHDADVGEATSQRCDTEVPVGSNVHLATLRQAGHAVEVGAKCPATRACGKPREAEQRSQSRRPAVSRNHHGRTNLVIDATRSPRHSDNAILIGHERTRHQDTVLEPNAGSDGGVEKRVIEESARQRHGRNAGRIVRVDMRTIRARHRHATDRDSECADAAAETD